MADHRLAVRPREVEAFARAVAAALGVAGDAGSAGGLPDVGRRWVAAAGRRTCKRTAAAGLVLAGDGQPPAVHALAHAINDALGNVGKTVLYTEPVEAAPADQVADRASWSRTWTAGEVEVLLILGGNPVYTAPADLDFAEQLTKVPLRVHLGLYEDETAARCHWHIPEAHYLESWGDARAFDGTACDHPAADRAALRRPLGPRAARRARSTSADRAGCEIVREYWRQAMAQRRAGRATSRRSGERSLHDGVIADTRFAATPSRSASRTAAEAHRPERRPPEPATMKSSSAPTRRSSTAGSPTTAGCRSCPSRSPS